MAAVEKMKNGEECDLLARLAKEPAFGLTEEEMKALLTPSRYIGRCPEQVGAFAAKIKPLLAGLDDANAAIEL